MDIPISLGNIAENGNVSLTFKPQMAGRHQMTIQVYGSTLESFEIEVQRCATECVLGKNGEFTDANGITCDLDGNLFIVDAGLGVVHKFNSSGKQIWSHNFLEENGCVAFDVTCSRETGILYCTVQKPGEIAEMQNGGQAPGGDADTMQKSVDLGAVSPKLPVVASTSADASQISPQPCGPTDTLNIFEVEVRSNKFLCIEKQAYLGLTRNDSIILSDPIHNIVMVYNNKGQHMHTFDDLELDCPAFVIGQPLEQILVSDIGNNIVKIAGYYDNDSSGHVTAWTNGESWIEAG